MTKKLSTFALMACLTSSFTLAGAQTKSTQSANDTKAASAPTVISASPRQDGHGNPGKNTDKKKIQYQAKPAPSTSPSTQEQEFDRVLLGIYG